MGCGLVKEKKVIIRQTKRSDAEIRQDIINKNKQFSLYTVREELSEYEQSYAPSKRQSILNPVESTPK
ncbi:hypothetical protein SteCoe_25400 [Stentor coeruleus]|uniref:Uncharacterized protein n=1 Tax=Stentor coeruleus TaxID=5963 RepID=A0A1R2BF87_9CILI|nr:hypothetical protein SteCoe_25400 [Stentor coeruleus]